MAARPHPPQRDDGEESQDEHCNADPYRVHSALPVELDQNLTTVSMYPK